MRVLLSLRLRRLLLWGQVEQNDEIDGIPFKAGTGKGGVFENCVCEGYVDVSSFLFLIHLSDFYLVFQNTCARQHDIVLLDQL